MKKLILLSFCFVYIFANNSEILEKARYYEEIGDYKNAMIYYKKLANITEEITNPTLDKNAKNKSKPSIDKEKLSIAAKELNESQDEVQVQVIDLQKKYKTANESEGIIIHKYKPTYMSYAYDLTGKEDRKRGELKFQLSIQKPIIDNLLGLNETFTFAYTQQSFWQIWEDSAPFRTTNYEPEVFVTFPLDVLNFDYLRFGLNHQSNGEDGDKSRSWNRVYVGTNFNIGNLDITPRIWKTFALDNTNKDIEKYFGYGDIEFKYKLTNSQILATLRNNMRFNSQNKGSLELNYFFPIGSTKFQGFLNYFTGYGESLADYNRHVDKIGLGVSLIND